MPVCQPRFLALVSLLFPVLASHASAPSDLPLAGTFLPEERHRRLDRLVCQERNEEAIELARAVVDSFPGDFVLTDLAIRAMTDAGQVEEGFGFLEACATRSGVEGLQAFVRAELRRCTGRKEEALSEFGVAAAACRSAGDSLGLAVVLLRNADCLSALKRAEEAVSLLRQAAASAAAAGVPRYELLCADALAGCFENLNQWREGLGHMISALDLARAAGDWCLEGRLLSNIGSSHNYLGECEAAAGRYREAASLAREHGQDRTGISRAARAGNALARWGRIGEALAQYEATLQWARESGYRDLERRILRDIGSAHRRSGDPETALEYFEEAFARVDPSEAGSGEAARLVLFKANALNDIGRFREARSLLGEARRLDVSDRGLQRGILNGLGNSFAGLGEIDSALVCYQDALELSRQTTPKSAAGLCLGNLAGCLTLQGRFEEAIAKYGEAAVVFAETGSAVELSQTHLNIAAIYSSLGRGDLAEQRCEKAVSILREHELRTHLSGCLIMLGTVYKNRGEFAKAYEAYTSASEEAEATGTTTDLIRAFVFLGELASLQGNLEEADAHFRSALSRARESGECRLEIHSLVGLGGVELAKDDPEAALDHFQGALELAARTRSERLRIDPATGLAEAQRALGRDEEAFQSYQVAIRAIEGIRRGVGSEEERRTYFDSRAHVYADALALLWRGSGTTDNKEIELWNLVEAYRARTFIDRLEEQTIDPDRLVAAELVSERSEILARHNRLHSRLISRMSELARSVGGGRDQALREDELVLSLSAQIDSLNEAYDRIEGRIRQARVASAGGDEFAPASIAQVTQLLEGGTALLEYLVAGENVFLFHLTTAGSLAVRVLSADGLTGVAELATLLRQGKSPSTFDARRFAELAWEAFRDYVEPAGLYWESTKRLVIVRDGPLAHVPFEVLLTRPPDDSRPEDPAELLRRLPYLFRACNVSYVPSATSLFTVCRSRAGSADGRAGRDEAGERLPGDAARYWVLVNPEYGERSGTAISDVQRGTEGSLRPYDFSSLPHSVEEGLAIASLVGEGRCVIHQGSDASEERVKSGEMESYERIHIAAHAYLNEESPLLSALVLAQDADQREDGFLTMREIYDLRLDAELVVLSSCETAAGRQYEGDGVVALARPFLAVGARSTIVSLWPVDDRSTVSWMDGFYQSLIRYDDKEKALADAREAMLRSQRPLWRLPYYWAPFILVGDYR